MRSRSRTDWVIVKFADEVHDGKVTLWRDYGTLWGSPSYTVLGYFTGPYREARKEAKRLKEAL
jgi:hypothetical protein